MAELLNVRNFAWILTTVLELVLLFYLVRQGLYRTHVAFFLYILAAVVQSAVVASSYRYWGPRSVQSWKIAWGSQGVVVCARWLAVMEITKRVLANYGGIWGMARRILILLSLSVLIYAIAFSGSRWNLMVLNGDRAVELCMATFIVSMFLFARYYRLPMTKLDRILAIGFGLYSCFYVINDSIDETWHSPFGGFWNHLEIVTFFASLVLWIGAARRSTETQKVEAEAAVSPERYEELSEKVNSRLYLLNRRLSHLHRSGDSKS
jgi:hypothetical protein